MHKLPESAGVPRDVVKLSSYTRTWAPTSISSPHVHPGMKFATAVNKAVHASPIQSRAFLDALNTAWKRPTGNGAPRFPKVALAVSGGVDSMALAVLCKEINRDFPNSTLKLRAFVVDHAARPGSDIEAQQVAKDIGKLKIRTKVLTLQWPKNVKPLELPNFESQARRLRYQALGAACKEYGIQSLLSGHHADDQAETVLMRLANGHRGLGLRGMDPSTEIPECWGMHGVHLSGALEPKEGSNQAKKKKYNKRKVVKMKKARNEHENTEIAVEAGGIKIYRPLLGYSKKQLIATCRRNATPWVEDHTNHDSTLTPRNAIRHLLQGSSLPLALQSYSLVGLSHRMKHKAEYRDRRVDELFRACEVIDFHTRSGTLTFRFPKHMLQNPSTDPIVRNREIDRAGYIAAALLKRVLEFVTPQEVVRLRDLGSAVRTIFPNLSDLDSTETEKTPTPTPFTVASIYCQPIPLPLSSSSQTPHTNIPLDPNHAWLLSRQPYQSPTTATLPTCTFPPTLRVPDGVPTAWSEWQLWDGRFWVRVLNKTHEPLVVRPLAEHDLKPFRLALERAASVRFENRLNTVAPGGIRWTLPVLARKDDGRMLAAVSLGVGRKEMEGSVEWEVRYRAVDMGQRGIRKGRERRGREGSVERKGKGIEGRGGERIEVTGHEGLERQGRPVRQKETGEGEGEGSHGSVVRQYWL